MKTLKANVYLNSPGGRDIYSEGNFKKEGIELKFLDNYSGPLGSMLFYLFNMEKNQILNLIKIDKKKFFEDIQDIKIKNKLKDLTNAAFEKNIFGAPTFIVNVKIFCGQDRLDYAIDEYNS